MMMSLLHYLFTSSESSRWHERNAPGVFSPADLLPLNQNNETAAQPGELHDRRAGDGRRQLTGGGTAGCGQTLDPGRPVHRRTSAPRWR